MSPNTYLAANDSRRLRAQCNAISLRSGSWASPQERERFMGLVAHLHFLVWFKADLPPWAGEWSGSRRQMSAAAAGFVVQHFH
jgi:hypothetical protein